jgi:hypothetical protein
MAFEKTIDSLTCLHQVHSRLCFCTADDCIFHVCNRYLHHKPCYIVPGAWIPQIQGTSRVAKTDCSDSVSVLSWLSCKAAPVELGSSGYFAVGTGWDGFFLL